MNIIFKCSYSVIICFSLLGSISCKHQPQVTPVLSGTGDFPPEVGRIIINKCATAGCHNAASYQNSGGLLLDSWEHLFDGGSNGAVVVPYSIDYSSLLYFINTDSALGVVASPRMPYNSTPLSREEYLTIRNWIAGGAPDKDGNIPFASNAATRQKIYMVHLSCDIVAAIDVEKNVIMRYIPIGEENYPESPNYIRLSPDGRFAYVCFWFTFKVYKIDTYTDEVVAKIDLGNSFWNVLHLSDDGQKLLVSNGDNNSMMLVNTSTLQAQPVANTQFENPYAIASNAAFDTFFVTGLFGNTVYKFSNGNTTRISIDKKPLTSISSEGTPDPYDIIMSPDYSRYFLACSKSNEIRVMDAHSDTLIKVIPVGIQPQKMTISRSRPYLFVTCMEDIAAAGFKGSVYVIDYNTLDVVKKIEGRFYQPHGITVSDRDNRLYIFSRNQNYDGPAPHHQGPCTGRNGYYNVYNLNTFEPVTNRRFEVLVDPYIGDTRFK